MRSQEWRGFGGNWQSSHLVEGEEFGGDQSDHAE
jgi:hypothetical protein